MNALKYLGSYFNFVFLWSCKIRLYYFYLNKLKKYKILKPFENWWKTDSSKNRTIFPTETLKMVLRIGCLSWVMYLPTSSFLILKNWSSVVVPQFLVRQRWIIQRICRKSGLFFEDVCSKKLTENLLFSSRFFFLVVSNFVDRFDFRDSELKRMFYNFSYYHFDIEVETFSLASIFRFLSAKA